MDDFSLKGRFTIYHVRLMYDFYSRTMYFVFELLRKSFVHRTFVLRTSALMLLVVDSAADSPEVRLHGFLALRQILLCEEGCVVGRDVLQILLTIFHSS